VASFICQSSLQWRSACSSEARGRFVKPPVESGCSGLQVPADETTCDAVVAEVERVFLDHASAYTNRENEQRRIVRELWGCRNGLGRTASSSSSSIPPSCQDLDGSRLALLGRIHLANSVCAM
jgi:hypothetical protein